MMSCKKHVMELLKLQLVSFIIRGVTSPEYPANTKTGDNEGPLFTLSFYYIFGPWN
jgi:hypothetical protein